MQNCLQTNVDECLRIGIVDGGLVATLESIRNSTGKARTVGISNTAILDFLESDPTLSRAIEEAADTFERLSIDHSEQLKLDEKVLYNTCRQIMSASIRPRRSIHMSLLPLEGLGL